MVITTLYNSKILLSLHYFLTPEFQTFTNLLIGIFGVSNPTFFVFLRCLRFLRNYVSIIVNISNISNNTVLKYYLLWIFASIRRLFQLVVCIGVSAPPHLKKMTPSFANFPLKSVNYRSPLFRRFTPPSQIIFCSCTLSTPSSHPKKKQRMFQRTPKILKKFYR